MWRRGDQQEMGQRTDKNRRTFLPSRGEKKLKYYPEKDQTEGPLKAKKKEKTREWG